MKKKVRIVFIWTISIAVLILILLCISSIVKRKRSVVKYSDFFSESKDFDVLFFGSSHVLNGISPLDLWNDYGITSYNFGNHSETIPTSYWVMMNALDYTSPNVVIIDAYSISSNYKVSGDNYSSIHDNFDEFPLSFRKIEGVYDLLDDPNIAKGVQEGKVTIKEERTPIGLLWDFSVYHSRWNDLTKEDFIIDKTKNKGGEYRVGIMPLDVPKKSGVKEINSVGLDYLDKIIDECKKRNIKILVTYLPARDGFQEAANGLGTYLEDKGVDYINFMANDCINDSIDFYEEKGHLNPSGAKNVTNYIGDFLVKNYSLVDKRFDTNYSDWNIDYENFVDYKTGILKSQTKVDLYLMLLNDSSFSCNIMIAPDLLKKKESLIENISKQGKYIIDVSSQLEYQDFLNDYPDAIIEVRYGDTIVDTVFILDNKIYRCD